MQADKKSTPRVTPIAHTKTQGSFEEFPFRMANLRFVVIGAGLIGPRHAEHVLRRNDCTIFAIVDRSANGPGVASSCNALHFKTVDEMLAFCDQYAVAYPDAAIIATPNHTHAALGMQLANRGIHLLVEKPMASTAEDCLALMEFCDLRSVHLLIGHHRRFNPYIMATKAHMSRVGTPVAIQGVWALKKHKEYYAEKPWRRSTAHGGGALLINLIHDLDLLQYLIGPIEKVYAEPLPRQRPAEGLGNHVDEGAVLTLRFPNGCCGTFLCSDNVTSPFSFEAGTGENPLIPHHDVAGFYRIFGSEGTLSVPDLTLYHQNQFAGENQSWREPIQVEHLQMAHEEVQQSASDSMLTPPPSLETKGGSMASLARNAKPEPFDLQLEHFVNLITGVETEVKCSGLDAVRALLCIEAVVKSIESGAPQMVQPVSSIQPNSELAAQYT